MSLKVLCAGCGPEERDRAESDVRRALGPRVEGGSWTVSLVKVQRRWSVTLTHPPGAVVTCVAAEGGLADAIQQALGGAAGPAVRSSSSPAAQPPSVTTTQRPGQRASRHVCGACQAAFVVRYEAAPDEAEETVAVACPHCWHRNYVLMAESAAETKEFTAEKA